MNLTPKLLNATARVRWKFVPRRLLVALLFILPAHAQQTPDVRMESSRTLFAVLAALRAGAPDLADRVAPRSPVTDKLDAALGELDPSLTEPLALYLDEIGFRGTEYNLSAFVSLAMLLEGPPNFDFVIPREQLPPDVLQLTDFPNYLKHFYRDAQLESVWRSVRPFYDEMLVSQRGAIARALLETRTYLRLIRTSRVAELYVVYPEWLVPRGLVSARNYGRMYFLVLHPGRDDLREMIRHQYLHFLLDRLVSRHRDDLGAFSKLADRIAGSVPRLAETFKQDDLLLIQESFVQAIEVRLSGVKQEDLAGELSRREFDGMLFIRHFNKVLAEFEEDVVSIDYHMAEIFESYPAKKEMARLEARTFPPPEPEPEASPPPPPPPPPDPAGDLLREAQLSLQAQDYANAQRLFDRVLNEIDSEEERAFYGLGLVASAEGNRFRAAQFFQRSIKHGSRPSIIGWANVYLGRIYDLEGAREEALGFYRAALEASGGDTGIEGAARQGLSEPFGGE